MLRHHRTYTAEELTAYLGPYLRHIQKSGVFLIDRSPTVPTTETADQLLWECGCRASHIGTGGDGRLYYQLAQCSRHPEVPGSPTMAARLVADMFALTDLERQAIISVNDPDIGRLFDVAASNIDPSKLSTIVRDSALMQSTSTIVDELLAHGARAALDALRTAYESLPSDVKVSRQWTPSP